MKSKKWYGPIIISTLILIIGLVTFIRVYDYWRDQTISVNNPIINKVDKDTQSLNLNKIIHEAQKHVVQIEGQSEDNTITGSGFVYNDKGDIITNAHVINNSDLIYVRTSNAHIYPAAIIGIGEDIDIAVIRVPQLAKPSYLQIDDEQLSEIGDEIIALGSPHGFQNTVTLGIISGTERNFSVDGFDYRNVYQISAQITHGNSGGPLINRNNGNVIGINSVGTQDGTIGFSIPVHEVIDQIEKWSNEAINEDLEFSNMSDVLTHYDPEQLKTDAEYLIDYFFEGIKVRDYLMAYTLLGSNMQLELSYADFRDKYTHIVELNFDKVTSTIIDENLLDSKVEVSIESKSKDKDETDTEKFEFSFTIGLENDQLKILKITNTLIE